MWPCCAHFWHTALPESVSRRCMLMLRCPAVSRVRLLQWQGALVRGTHKWHLERAHGTLTCIRSPLTPAPAHQAVMRCRFRGPGGARLLQRRGGLVVRKLAARLGGRAVLSMLSSILEDEQDLPFAAALVQALNLILLTAPEVCADAVMHEGYLTCPCSSAPVLLSHCSAFDNASG